MHGVLCFLVILSVILCATSSESSESYVPQKQDLHVVTVVTDPRHPHVQWLKQSAAKHGIPVHVLVSSKPIGHAAGGHFGQKITLTRAFLNSNAIPPDDLVMFVDGYDVVLNGSKREISRRFHAIARGRDVAVFAAELFCWPDRDLEDEYAQRRPTNSAFKYLNSGTYMGRASTLKRILNENFEGLDDTADDQRVFTSVFLRTDDIVLDHATAIFLAVCGAEPHLEELKGRWRNALTGTDPLVYHGNGCGMDFWKLRIVPSVIS